MRIENRVKNVIKEFKLSLKMKRIVLILSFVLMHSYFCIAQQDDRVEAVRMAYITKELSLTSDEAQKFWPVYNNYWDEIKKARDEFPSDELSFEERVVAIRKKYKNDFKKVLGADDRVNKTYTVDRKFRDVLKDESEKREQERKNNSKQ
jgi:hypothetical protein